MSQIKLSEVNLKKVRGIGPKTEDRIRRYFKENNRAYVGDIIDIDGTFYDVPQLKVSEDVKERMTKLFHEKMVEAGWTKCRRQWFKQKVDEVHKLAEENDTPLLFKKLDGLEQLKKKIKYDSKRR